MKKKEIEKKLKNAGFIKKRAGSKHDVWEKSKKNIMVPRHNNGKDLKKGTILSIIKEINLVG